MKKYFFILLFFFVFFIGFKANALTQNGVTVYTSNYGVVAQCTNCNSVSGADFPFEKIRYTINSPGLTGGISYHYVLNGSTSISNTNSPIIPSACYMYVNNQYLTVQNESLTRTSYECGQLYCNSNWTYEFDRLIQTSQVPDVFVECDFPNNLNLKFRSTSFVSNFNILGDSTISAINNNSQSIQNANQSNTNSINSHIDSLKNQNTTNSNSIIGKIQDFMDSFASGVRSITSTISNGVVEIISTLSSLGSNIVSGVSQAISTGVSSVVNKIGDLIGMNEVCTTYFYANGTNVSYGTASTGLLQSDGTINSNSNYRTTERLKIDNNESFKIDYKSIPTSSTDLRICYFNGYGNLLSCNYYWDHSLSTTGTFNYNITDSSSVRFFSFSYPVGSPNTTIRAYGNCHQSGILGIFNRLGDFMNKLFSDVLGLDRIGTILNKHKNILDNSAFDSLSDFIHSPINFIHSLESTSCTGLTLTVFSQNITLPSGCIFWSREDVSSFRDFWNLLFGGFLIYRMGYRLFKALNDSIDPTKDDLGGLEI